MDLPTELHRLRDSDRGLTLSQGYRKLVFDASGAFNKKEASKDDLEIAAGGEATVAYGRLQYEALDEATRASLKAKLLRYCELDTLAMAMVVEAWGHFLGRLEG